MSIINQYTNFDIETTQLLQDIKGYRILFDKLFSEDFEDEDLPDGAVFRKEKVYIKNESSTKIIHMGASDEKEITKLLGNLVNFMMRQDLSFLIKILVSHYYFEYIYPFYNGNGRMGRFLVSSYLVRKLDIYTGFSFSSTVRERRKKYLEAFEYVTHPSNKGELTFFVNNLLSIILESQNSVLNEMSKMKDELNYVHNNLSKNKELTAEEKQILYILCQNELFDIEPLGTYTDLPNITSTSKHILKRIFNNLEKKEFVVKESVRPIVFKTTKKIYDI